MNFYTENCNHDLHFLSRWWCSPPKIHSAKCCPLTALSHAHTLPLPLPLLFGQKHHFVDIKEETVACTWPYCCGMNVKTHVNLVPDHSEIIEVTTSLWTIQNGASIDGRFTLISLYPISRNRNWIYRGRSQVEKCTSGVVMTADRSKVAIS